MSKKDNDKLDPVLRHLIAGEEINKNKYSIDDDGEGNERYGVLIETSNVEEIRESGIQLNSIQGSMVTAKLTLEEIIKLMKLSTISSIKIANKNEIH